MIPLHARPADDASAAASIVQTVLGPVDISALGWTLAHEHFFTKTLDAPGMLLRDEEIAALELADAAAVGTRTVIDLTTFDLLRDPAALRRLSARTGVNIVMGTGWYLHKTYPERIALTSTAALADELIRDIEEGVDGVRPGVIGEIGTWETRIEAREERVLRAVARAQRATGLAVFIHQQRVLSGPAVLDILGEEGVAAESVVLCHTDSIGDPAATEAAVATGAWIAFDRLQGWDLVFQPRPWEVQRRVDALVRARRDGYLDRILLSTDCCVLGDLARYGGPGYAFTHGTFAGLLRLAGFTEDELEQLFARNPAAAIRRRSAG